MFRKKEDEKYARVRDAMVRMVRNGRIVSANFDRHGISEVSVEHEGHRISGAWFSSGRPYRLNFDGKPSPLTGRHVEIVFDEMKALGEREFEARAEQILGAAND